MASLLLLGHCPEINTTSFTGICRLTAGLYCQRVLLSSICTRKCRPHRLFSSDDFEILISDSKKKPSQKYVLPVQLRLRPGLLLPCREAEEQKARLAAELQARQRAEEEERAQVRREKEAARMRLKRLEQTFALRLESSIEVSRPPKVNVAPSILTAAARSWTSHMSRAPRE